MTHWKHITNPEYLGSWDFKPKEERQLTCIGVKREFVVGPGGKKEECTVMALKDSKPVIFNNTNCKRLSKVLGTPEIEEWVGKSFYVGIEQVNAFGEMVDAIRVKTSQPALPELKAGTANFDAVRAALVAGTHTIEQAKSKYRISPDVEQTLTAK